MWETQENRIASLLTCGPLRQFKKIDSIFLLLVLAQTTNCDTELYCTFLKNFLPTIKQISFIDPSKSTSLRNTGYYYHLKCVGGVIVGLSGYIRCLRHITQLINLTERWKEATQKHKLDLCLFLYLHILFCSNFLSPCPLPYATILCWDFAVIIQLVEETIWKRVGGGGKKQLAASSLALLFSP